MGNKELVLNSRSESYIFNPFLKIAFFEDLQRIQGRSQNTVLAYRRDIEVFEEYLSVNSRLDGVFGFLKSKALGERSQARIISSFRTYCRFCDTRGYRVDHFLDLKPPVIENIKPQKVLSPDDFLILVKAAELSKDEDKTFRNKLTLYLLYCLGIKVTELINLNLRDIDLFVSEMVIRNGAKPNRNIKLSPEVKEMLSFYIKESRLRLLRIDTESLIINDRGNRPSRVDIWRWLSAWSKAAGLKETLGPQSFRHGCAQSLRENGFDHAFLKELLGHRYLQTTVDFYS